MDRVRLSSPSAVLFNHAGVVLHSDMGDVGLPGGDALLLAKKVLPLLDGSRDRNEVVDTISTDLRPSAVAFINLLERYGLLEALSDGGDLSNPPILPRWEDQQRFLRAWSEEPTGTMQRLQAANVLILGLEPWGAVAAGELAAAGIGALHIVDEGVVLPGDLLSVRMWRPNLVGCLRAQALSKVLEEAAPWCKVTFSPTMGGPDNARSRERWDLVIGTIAPEDRFHQMQFARYIHEAELVALFGSLRGGEAFIGPVVIPKKTACWNCCRLRLLANAAQPWAAHVVQDASSSQDINTQPRMRLAPMAPVLGHLLALEALKLLSGYALCQLFGQLLIHNLITLETTRHTIIPMPWCEICGGAQSTRKDERTPLQLRTTETPQGLLQCLRGWVDPRTGIISRLEVIRPEPSDPRLPVCATAVLSSYTDGVYDPTAIDSAGGKGLSETEAMIGAVGEAIERYSASRIRVDQLHQSPIQALTGDILDPRCLCLYEESQYRRPDFPFVRFDPERPHLWTSGRWMDDGERVWVPALPTFYLFPDGSEDAFCQVTSNGLAAGADWEDAALRAVCELVERDACMLTWLCRRPGRRLLVDATLEPGILEVIQQLQLCGAQLELYLLDVGLSIPTVICLGFGDGQRWPGVTVGSAAHPSPRIAARKAILEQGYSGSHFRRAMLRGDPIPDSPEQVRTFLDHALYYVPKSRAKACDFLRYGGDPNPVSLATLPEPTDLSLKSCAVRLTACGVRVALVDATAPDVAQGPFRVVRALGTNMQPLHCGFGLERLDNPRLRTLLVGEINPDLHPLC
jgi:ribosomal protein S12 methylthiotransferase accessory factor